VKTEAQRSDEAMPHINHWNVSGFRQNVTRKQLKEILLYHSDIMKAGHLLYAKTKHLGAGIYQLWYERAVG